MFKVTHYFIVLSDLILCCCFLTVFPTLNLQLSVRSSLGNCGTATRGVFRSLSNIIRRRLIVKLRKLVTIFVKSSILHVHQGSEYTFGDVNKADLNIKASLIVSGIIQVTEIKISWINSKALTKLYVPMFHEVYLAYFSYFPCRTS